MPMRFSAATKLDQVIARLRVMTGRAKNLEPVYRRRIAPDMAREIAKQYATRGRHFRTPWKSVSQTTLELRRQRGQRGDSPMIASGQSKRSLTRVNDPGGVRVYTPLTMRFGSRYEHYLERHHRPQGFKVTHVFGQKLKRPRRVPPRYVLPPVWPSVVLQRWERELARHVNPGGTTR